MWKAHSQLNLQKIEQDYKKYRYYYVVCSKHFPDGKLTDQYPDPVPADPSSKIAKTPKRKDHVVAKMTVPPRNKRPVKGR